MTDNLVIVRAGSRSLHPAWLGPAADRDWDLYICPYEPVRFESGAGVTVGRVIPGQKWTGLTEILDQWPADAARNWREYRYIWLPDDDIFVAQPALNDLFRLARRLDAGLCAPALHECSFFTHIITMCNKSFVARTTNFVEIMMPCFGSEVLSRLLPTLALSESGTGWGLDFLWAHLLGNRGLYIIDSVTALHTRPVSAGRSAAHDAKLMTEMYGILNSHDVSLAFHSLGGLDANFNVIGEDAPDFMLRLIRGWSYLLDAAPGRIGAILRDQGYRRAATP